MTLFSITYTYDYANRLVSRVISAGETINYTYDDNGNLTQQVSSLNGTTTYGYDYENRLVSAVTPSSEAYYGYSGDGRRTYSYIDSNEVEYIYDGLTPLIERNGPGTYIAAYTKLPGAPGGIGGLISSYDGTNTLYYHDSNLGNLNQVTNSAGAVIQTYDYDAFGYITAQSGALTAKYAYKTKEYSPQTGLIFFGRRYYNPLIGRFITKDPLGQADGPNVYLYCNNDPVNKYDPWGLTIIIIGNKKDYDEAIKYLQCDAVMAKIIDDLRKSSVIYTVILNDDDNDSYDPSTNTISWDPHSALKLTNGGKQSPALGLGHEMDHANANFFQRIVGGIPWPEYDNLEERRVIKGSETHAANTLGEGKRKNHSGSSTYRVPTPTSR